MIYLLSRGARATRVAEFATSVGMSTLYFAAAMRDNGGGAVIGSEIVPAKVAIAKRNLADAGLADYAEIREGDARQTLRDLGGPVDFILIDGWPRDQGPSLAREVIEITAPQLRGDGYVMNDNAEPDFLEYVRDPKNGFLSITLPLKGRHGALPEGGMKFFKAAMSDRDGRGSSLECTHSSKEVPVPYVDGFVIPVAKDKVDVYKAHARKAGEVWMEYGALSFVECVGDDVPYGQLTSFPRAVQATDDETVIFSWIVYRSRADRDAIMEKVMADPRIKGDMPFDAKRLIFGGFEMMFQM